jgi:Tol biopolymer transport system component
MMILNKTVSITVLALVLFLVSGTFALADSFNIKRISVADMGSEGDGASSSASISADGRYVAFSSNSSNLVPDDTNGMGDVFVFDRNTNTIERVSVATSGEEANGSSFYSKTPISADGRYVAFASFASNLVAGDTNGVLCKILKLRIKY